MVFGLEKCAIVCFKSGKVHGKHIGNTVENEIKQLRVDESM
jgi:hypothetical protein